MTQENHAAQEAAQAVAASTENTTETRVENAFASLGIADALLRAVTDMGYTTAH